MLLGIARTRLNSLSVQVGLDGLNEDKISRALRTEDNLIRPKRHPHFVR